jgi:hypothetical protein
VPDICPGARTTALLQVDSTSLRVLLPAGETFFPAGGMVGPARWPDALLATCEFGVYAGNMDAFSSTRHVLDVSTVVGEDMDEEQVDRVRKMLKRLATTSLGSQLLILASRNRVTIRIAPDRELRLEGRGIMGGLWLPAEREIRLRDVPDDNAMLTILAHEFQHFADNMLGWGSGNIDSEVRANQTESIIARELGVPDRSEARGPDGELDAPVAIAERLRRHKVYEFYKREPPRPDGRLHPLLTNAQLLPSSSPAMVPGGGGTGAIGRVGAVGPVQTQTVRRTEQTQGVNGVNAIHGLLAAARGAWRTMQTEFTPTPAEAPAPWVDRYLEALEMRNSAISEGQGGSTGAN